MSFLCKIADIGNAVDAFVPDAGDVFESLSDRLGLPEEVGDVASLIANGTSGNWLGVAGDLADLAGNAASDAPPFEWLLPEERPGGPGYSTYTASPDAYVFTDGHFER